MFGLSVLLNIYRDYWQYTILTDLIDNIPSMWYILPSIAFKDHLPELTGPVTAKNEVGSSTLVYEVMLGHLRPG